MDLKGTAWKIITLIIIIAFIVQLFPLQNNNQSTQTFLNVSNFTGTFTLNASINFFNGNNYIFCNSTLQNNVSTALQNAFNNKTLFQGATPLGVEFLVQDSNYSTIVNKARLALKNYCAPLVFREAGVQVLDPKVQVNTTQGIEYLTNYQFGEYAVSNGVIGKVNNLTLFGVPAMISDSTATLNSNVTLQGQLTFANNSIQQVNLVQTNFNPALNFVNGQLNATIQNFTGFQANLQIPWSDRNEKLTLFNTTPITSINNTVIVKGNVSTPPQALSASFNDNTTVLEFPQNFTNQSFLNLSNAFYPPSVFTFNFNSTNSFENISKQIQSLGYNFTLYKQAVFTFNPNDFMEKFGFYNSSTLTGLTGNLNTGDNLTLNITGLTEDGVVVSVNAVQSNLNQ